MAIWEIIVWVIIIISIFALAARYLYYLLQEKKPDQAGRFVINFMGKYSYPDPGIFYGIEVDEDTSGDRTMTKILPKHWDKNLLKKGIEPRVQTVFSERNQIENISIGNAHFKIILPTEAEDYPDELKKTSFGRALINRSEKMSAQNAEVSGLREGIRTMKSTLKKMGAGEITEAFYDQMTEEFKRLQDLMDKKKPEQTGSGFNQPTSPYR